MHGGTLTWNPLIRDTPPEFAESGRDIRIDICRGIALWIDSAVAVSLAAAICAGGAPTHPVQRATRRARSRLAADLLPYNPFHTCNEAPSAIIS